MRAVKWIGIALLVYLGIVALFESGIGYFQPSDDTTLVITTTDAGGSPHERVLARIRVGDQLYVAANHWPRAWYDQALEHPEVEVTLDGVEGPYQAVPVSGAEHDRLQAEHPLPLVIRFLTGFPPRYFLRLDPR